MFVYLTKIFVSPVFWIDRSGTTRFFQAKDEQGSLRAIGAIGLMLVTSEQRSATNGGSGIGRQWIDSKADRICLTDRLRNAGIPSELVSRIADEIRSGNILDRLYTSIEDEGCRDRVLVPLIADLCIGLELVGTAVGWSTAIHRAWFSAVSDPSVARKSFGQLRHLVEDHALLLDKIHTGLSPDAALDALLSAQQLLHDEHERTVSIELPTEHKNCFPSESADRRAFFSLIPFDKAQKIPSIVMRTTAGPYSSARLLVFLLDGEDFVHRLVHAFLDGAECVAVARNVARMLKQDFCAAISSGDAIVLLIRGMECALDRVARQNGFRSETRVLGK